MIRASRQLTVIIHLQMTEEVQPDLVERGRWSPGIGPFQAAQRAKITRAP